MICSTGTLPAFARVWSRQFCEAATREPPEAKLLLCANLFPLRHLPPKNWHPTVKYPRNVLRSITVSTNNTHAKTHKRLRSIGNWGCKPKEYLRLLVLVWYLEFWSVGVAFALCRFSLKFEFCERCGQQSWCRCDLVHRTRVAVKTFKEWC